ncbi:hypothetical protein CH63R_07267 [Colletotrichum higginsianum IMI 349063]|uniref:Uncharacterized protein n=2 Tax=Colletotrichum higginsianum (strain IMI 349063) TaxID=759273 RepID=A0A1B7Y902_COLHI|nr:hypothetical protein CH63R_07267 [Colletotrichum higginsianum IMI 349063]OBR08502.1 hypothetical protein CH63R_07267 [Colletotrichum higginsianum IMI 349063]
MQALRLVAAIYAVVAGVSAAAVSIRRRAPENAAAAAVSERRQLDNGPRAPEVVWAAENYIWGCSPGGCSSRFNISAPDGYIPGAPGFNVVCSPIYIQQGRVPCRNPDNSPLPPSNGSQVFSIWTAGADRERQYLGVSHIYKRLEDGRTWNATAGTDFLPVRNMSIAFPVTTHAIVVV